MRECFKSSIHTTIRILKDMRSFDSYNINCNNIAHNERSKSASKIDAFNNSCDSENHQNTYSFDKFDNTSSQPRHRVIDLIPNSSTESAVDTTLNDSLMFSPMNINDTSIASDAFSSNDSYDRLRTIINNREEGNDGYGIAMRNLDKYTEDGDLESDDIVCSIKPYSCMKNNNACCFYYAQCACD